VDPGGPSSGRSCPSDGHDNDDSEGEKNMPGSGKGTGKENGTNDGKGKGKGNGKRKGKAMEEGKGKGKGNCKGKGSVKLTPGGDDISCAVALQLPKEMYEADSDMAG